MRIIEDILSYTTTKHIPGLLILIDFEKAFDTVEWNFLFKSLKSYNIGSEFISWVKLLYNNITKAPFEPIKEASLKYLTFKTVFLLAQGSGKRRSEILAWQNRNIRHQSDWSKVSLYPSPSFLSKNQLAKEGPDCVAPVVIPALAPTLDRSLKSDRSLCPVRALRYYLDRTSDLRQNKELVCQ